MLGTCRGTPRLFTHSLIHSCTHSQKFRLQGKLRSEDGKHSLINKSVAQTKTLAKESGDEKLMVTVPNCLVKIYQGQPRGALADITKKWGPTFPQKEHIPPIPRLHSYIQITAQRQALSGCQTKQYIHATHQKTRTLWRGPFFLQRWLFVRAAFAWLKQL